VDKTGIVGTVVVVSTIVSMTDDPPRAGTDCELETELRVEPGSNGMLEDPVIKLGEVAAEDVIVGGLNGIERVFIPSGSEISSRTDMHCDERRHTLR